MSDKNAWDNRKPIFDRLPGFLEKYSGNSLVSAIVAQFDDFLSDLLRDIRNFKSNLIAETTPERWLNYLGNLSGFTGDYWRIDYPVSFKRALIGRANWIWKNKGSKDVLSYVLTSYGIENQIVPESNFIIGLSRVGDRIGTLPWEYTIFINPNQENIEQLKLAIPEFVRLYAPFWTVYRLIEDPNRFIQYSFLGFFSDTIPVGLTGENAGQDFLFETSQNRTNENPISGFSQLTLDYKAALELAGFVDNDNFYGVIDRELVKPLEQAGLIDDIYQLSLFIGDNINQKIINIIGSDANSSANLTVSSDGLNFGATSTLVYPLNKALNAVTLSFMLIEAEVNTSERNVYSATHDTGSSVFSNQIVSGDLVVKNTVNGSPVSYPIDIAPSTVSYLGSTENGVISFNEFDIASQTVLNRTIQSVNIGASSYIGKMRYFLIRNKNATNIESIVNNYFRQSGYILPLSITEYHPDTLEFRQRCLDASSDISEARLSALNDLISNLYDSDIYSKLNYALPFCSIDFNGVGCALKLDNQSVSGITSGDYDLLNGLEFVANPSKFITLSDTISSADLTIQNRTYFSIIKTVEMIPGIAFYGCGNFGQRFTLEPTAINRIGAYFASNQLSTTSRLENKVTLITQHNRNNVGEIYLDSALAGTGNINISSMQSQAIRIGTVILENVAQTQQNTFDLQFFGRFTGLSQNELGVAGSLIKQFNSTIR